MSEPIDAVLIDFYGTISAGDREVVESVCRRVVAHFALPIAPEDFAVRWGERFFAVIDDSSEPTFRTLHECELISLAEMLDGFGIQADPAPFVADLEAYWRNPPVHPDALAFLHAVNLPLCCVSNADTEPLSSAIEKHDLRFEAVISSQAARSYKPHRGIFEKAIAELGISTDRVIHIGDSLHSDVGGAISMGIRSCWVQRHGRIHDIGKLVPHWTCSVLTDVLPILNGTNL